MSAADFQIKLDDENFWWAVGCIGFNPLYWNLIARYEYRTRAISRAFGSARVPCIVLALSIFLLGIYRDLKFKAAIQSQPTWYLLSHTWLLWLGYACMVYGFFLVITSFVSLGFFGTYLGDYFGILMDEKVTGFPFNIMENPMYWGSTLNFLGYAIVCSSQAGLLLTLWVAVVYKIALAYEGPFTEEIYRNREEKKDR